MHILLVNGKPGTGKTSVSRKLLGLLPEPAAWIDTDDLMRMHPFHEESAFTDALHRGLLLVRDFESRGYAHVILSGCVHSSALWEQLKNTLSGGSVAYIHLKASPDICDERKRAQGYSAEKHPTMFHIIHDTSNELTADAIAPCPWISIDTSSDTQEEIAQSILKIISE